MIDQSFLGKRVSDEELAQRIYTGDAAAYETLYTTYKDKIYSYVWTILNYNAQEAIEVTSEVFLHIFSTCQKIQITTNFSGLLYKTAHNMAVNRIKKWSGKEQGLDEKMRETKQDTTPGPVATANQEHEEVMIKKMLSLLDERSREVLFLSYTEKKDYETIAELLGTNKNTIGTILSRAKQKIKEIGQTYGRIE